MAAASMIARATWLLLLIPWASAQTTQCAPHGSPQFRIVARLSVNGCALFVHDTGASDGPHLAVEPIMCVTKMLHKVAPRFDAINQQLYLSVPVILRDDAMLAEAQRQLRHLSPKSVKFATVSDISVSTDESSKLSALGFIWSPEDSIGFLRLGCHLSSKNCSVCNLASIFSGSQFEALEQAVLSARVNSNGTFLQLQYRLAIQNQTFTDPDFYIGRFGCLPECQQLRFVRSIRLSNCTARVHQRLDMKGHFLVEPLLCPNITGMISESVLYDYSREMYYLKLDVVLQDDMAVDAVKTQLADLAPRSVTFMGLWHAQTHVASALSRRFVVGPLMVSGDGRSAQLRVHCVTKNECVSLSFSVTAAPVDYWMHVKFLVTSLVSDRCVLTSKVPKHPWRMQEVGTAPEFPACHIPYFQTHDKDIVLMPHGKWFIEKQQVTDLLIAFYEKSQLPDCVSPASVHIAAGLSVMFMRRSLGNVDFARPWSDYESGFGNCDGDFWLGLRKIVILLGPRRATLRVEMKLWTGADVFVEYSGFIVGDASTNYYMSYTAMANRSSQVTFDAMDGSKDIGFSTMNHDNDRVSGSCSKIYNGHGGFWLGGFRAGSGCGHAFPTAGFPTSANTSYGFMIWTLEGRVYTSLKEIRMYLKR